MTGFTLGTEYGATLGTEHGGTLGTPLDSWALNGRPLATVTDETATHRTLTLTFRVGTETLLDRLRALKDDEGKVDVLVTDDGGFTAVDRADGANTFALEPPARRRPLRRPGEVHVLEYEESLVSADVEEWDVTVEFARAENRDDVAAIPLATQTPDLGIDSGGTLGTEHGFCLGAVDGATVATLGPDHIPSDWWTVDTRFGTLATERVSADFVGTGADGVERFELELSLTFAQAHGLEAALARIDGARIREIPDGPNAPVDDTPDDGNTLVIDAPGSDDVVPNDEYVVVAPFESERLNDEFQRISLEIARKTD